MLKKELEVFDIDLDSIEPTHNFYEQVNKAIEEMQRNTLKDRFEVVLNDNLIKTKEIKTNYRTICGCRISYDDLEKDISFIVREDDKPTYEQLEEENKKLKQQNEFLMKQDNILQALMQWLYKEQERYRKTLSERPTNDKEYINAQVTSVTLEQIKVVIDKIIELKEKMK